MGVYAHRFIEVLDKDNKWKALPVWNKHEEDTYGKPDTIIGELKLKKQLCHLWEIMIRYHLCILL